MEIGKPVPVTGFQIRSWDLDNNKETWQSIKHAVRKPDVKPFKVILENTSFFVAPDHQLWVKQNDKDPCWMNVSLIVNQTNLMLWTNNGWVNSTIEQCDKIISILDIEVEGTHAYFSNGVLSHNTMYGDPMTTSGGLALPFHASTRISLTGGKRLEDPKTKEFFGIEVNAYVMKNKVSPPFRKISFQIHFGKGIFEHEELFDVLRAYCDDRKAIKNGKSISVSGTGAWKQLAVSDVKTGEVIIDKPFYKSDFGNIMRDAQYKTYVDDLIEIALTRTVEQVNVDKQAAVGVNPDGYETSIESTSKEA